MAVAPTQKCGRGHPPVANRFKKGQSGNPKGRPRKAAPAAEAVDMAAILDRIKRTRVPVQSGEGVREIVYIEALLQQLAGAALKNSRDGFRMLQLISAAERNSPLPPLNSNGQPEELLDDPIIKRQLEREMRRRLHRARDLPLRRGRPLLVLHATDPEPPSR